MKHTSLLINNLRAVLFAALTSGIVGTVNGQQLHPCYTHKSASRVRSVWWDWSRRYASRATPLGHKICSPRRKTPWMDATRRSPDWANFVRAEKCPARSNRHTTRRLRTRTVLLRFEKHAAGTSRDAGRYNGRAKPGRLQNGALWSDRCIWRRNARTGPRRREKYPVRASPQVRLESREFRPKTPIRKRNVRQGATRVQRRVRQPNTHLRQRNEEESVVV